MITLSKIRDRARVDFDPNRGWPVGEHLWLECARCGVSVPSQPGPDDAWACGCRNLRIDADAGRISVDVPGSVSLLRDAETAHFERRARLDADSAADPLRIAQLGMLRRLVLGVPLDAPPPAAGEFAGSVDRWSVCVGGTCRFDVLVHGGELVAFAAGTDVLVNYTIQSSLELDEPDFAGRPWSHDCEGAACEGCCLPG